MNEKHKLNPHVRIDSMARIFAELQKRLDALTTKYTERTADLEKQSTTLISVMEALEINVEHGPMAQRQLAITLGELRDHMIPTREQMADIEAQTVLSVSCVVNEKSKLKYSNPTTRSAAKLVALGKHDAYKKLRAELRALELKEMKLKAQLQEVERQDKANRSLYNGTVARLENLTARF